MKPKETKEEIEERFKNELATKEFVRAQINEVKPILSNGLLAYKSH